MMARTHYKAGVLFYIMFSTIIMALTVPFIAFRPSISIEGILVVVFAALLVDSDKESSKINYMNPVTGIPNRLLDLLNRFIIFSIRITFTVGVGVLLIKNAKDISNSIALIPFIRPYSRNIVYGVAVLLIIAGILGDTTARLVPVIGWIYGKLSLNINKLMGFIKRIIVTLIYVSSGIGLIYYNHINSRDIIIYLIGVILIIVAFSPHRTFLHSSEGVTLFILSASYVFRVLGRADLIWPFSIGYISHILLGDMFTRSGVPLFSSWRFIIYIMKKLRLYESVKVRPLFRKIDKVMSIRLRVPLMSTGTPEGYRFEACYLFIILITTFAVVFLAIKAGKFTLVCCRSK